MAMPRITDVGRGRGVMKMKRKGRDGWLRCELDLSVQVRVLPGRVIVLARDLSKQQG